MSRRKQPVSLPAGIETPDATIPQAAAYLNVKPGTIRRMLTAGAFDETFKVGDLRRITWRSVFRAREHMIAEGPKLGDKPLPGTRRPRGRPKNPLPAAE